MYTGSTSPQHLPYALDAFLYVPIWPICIQCLSELHLAFQSFPGSGWPHSAGLHQAIHGTYRSERSRAGPGPASVKKKSPKR